MLFRSQIVWCAFGNPTRTTGRFHKVCTRPGSWKYRRVDARTVRFTNKQQIEEWIREYGEDSDFVRVRVAGLFPRAGFSNFIGAELVESARRRTVARAAWQAHQKILSVDPACARRPNFDHPFRLNIDQGWKHISIEACCG